ncbi:MAG: hypothetical protein OJF61_002059 [Rhodanobacteraceae bacterium]|jgi:hypothetical protein|nr:MAG: hypothetical protein OJF61_002059 [Rhodanobacteraceae bacterium]
MPTGQRRHIHDFQGAASVRVPGKVSADTLQTPANT